MSWDILYKYMQDTCSQKEMEQLTTWLRESSANVDFFKTFVESWEEPYPVKLDIDTQDAWKNFKLNHFESAKAYKELKPPNNFARANKSLSTNAKVSPGGRLVWYSLASIVILLVIVAAYLTAQQKTIVSKKIPKITYRDIYTKKGQRTSLRLRDDTQIILNAGSRLRIPSSYGKSARRVYLQGEAFFNVKHNADLPFLVISHGDYVKDLGTEFNVMAYDSTYIEVVVKDGSVSLGKVKQGKALPYIGKLKKNNRGTLNKIGELSISTINDMRVFTAWSEGKLVFKDTPFSNVAKRLERWFNINIEIKDPALNNRTLTAAYDTMPFSEVLNVLSLSMHISYTQNGGTVIFTDKK